MLAHGSGIVSNLLKMITTCDNASEHTLSLKDQVNELPKVKLEGNHIKYISTRLCHAVCLEGISACDHACPSGWGSEVQTRCGHDQLTSYW